MGKIVFTNGCFDVLHVGHFGLLSFCRQLAGNDGRVIVAIDSDEKIKKDKGINRPYFSYIERAQDLQYLIRSLTGAEQDFAINDVRIFDTNEGLYEIIKEVKPDIIVKGTDREGNVIGSDCVLSDIFLY
jgi:D-beta-D-heptose 7-phosphate kinase / D-beta-D-heptose 1-phosphate adenosyltransferase